jgi:vacuolar-type H+-ATPase subunit B/Vma2
MREWRKIKKKYSFKCPICKRRILPPRPQDVNDFYLSSSEEIQHGLKLAHVRHKHTDYEEKLKQFQAEKDRALKELEDEKAEAMRQFALRRKELDDEFERSFLKVRQECNKKAEDILRKLF